MFTAIFHLALQQAVTCCLRICNLLLSSLVTLNSYNTDMLCLALFCAFCDEHVNFFPSSSRECYVYMNKCLHYSECTEVGIYSLSLGMSLTLSPFPLCRISFVMAQTYLTDVLKCRGLRADNPASAGAAGCSSQRGTIWCLIEPDSTMPFVSPLLIKDSIYRHFKFEYNQIEITQNFAPGVADCLKCPCF